MLLGMVLDEIQRKIILFSDLVKMNGLLMKLQLDFLEDLYLVLRVDSPLVEQLVPPGIQAPLKHIR